MNVKERKRTKRNLVIFTILVLGFAGLAGVVEQVVVPASADSGTPGLGQLLWLLSPFGVSLLLRIFGGDGWRDLGIRPNFKGNGFWWWTSILVFPAVITITGLIGIWLDGIELKLNLFPEFLTAVLSVLLFLMIKNIFEEFAWRGYLAPKVYSLDMNSWLSHTVVGLVWGAWHLPFVLVLWPYLTREMLWYFVPLLLIGTISQSVVYGEIRLATDSVWPAWVMHTIGNAFGNALLLSGFMQLAPGREYLFTPGAEGVLSVVVMLFVGYWLHQRRKD